MYSITTTRATNRMFAAQERRLRNTKRLLDSLAKTSKAEIDEQFEVEGRPSWPDVGPAYQAWKTAQGYGDKILQTTSEMRRSIRSRVVPKSSGGTMSIYTTISEPATGIGGQPTSTGMLPYPLAHLVGFTIQNIKKRIKSYVKKRVWNKPPLRKFRMCANEFVRWVFKA